MTGTAAVAAAQPHRRLLFGLLALAFVVSIVHYTDNYFNYSEFPDSESIPTPSATLVGLSWFIFTGAGIAGLLAFLRERTTLAAVLLAVYAGSGLVGFGHYVVPGAFEMPWWRQLHVVADIACGIALVVFAVWLARGRDAGPSRAS